MEVTAPRLSSAGGSEASGGVQANLDDRGFGWQLEDTGITYVYAAPFQTEESGIRKLCGAIVAGYVHYRCVQVHFAIPLVCVVLC